jgi:hypothetical protein
MSLVTRKARRARVQLENQAWRRERSVELPMQVPLRQPFAAKRALPKILAPREGHNHGSQTAMALLRMLHALPELR